METTNKTRIYNVIILDKSGSMSSIAKQAVDGVNETLGGIRSSQLKDPTQDNYVTLVAFCGCELRTIYDNTPIAEVSNITPNDYRPCCCTPLFDAVGTTITRLHPIVTDNKGAAAVTIITDGYENASREYSGKAIKDLIERYKNEGWMFAYIGADHDVEAVAAQMSIDNTLVFDKTEAGTREMFSRQQRSRSRWASLRSQLSTQLFESDEDRLKAEQEINKGFFDL